jgi:hypothetical protein
MATSRNHAKGVDMNGNPAIHGSATGSHRLRSTALSVAMAAALAIGGVAAVTAAGSGTALHGPEINRTLIGGIARDLSPQELRHVNRARGVAVR